MGVASDPVLVFEDPPAISRLMHVGLPLFGDSEPRLFAHASYQRVAGSTCKTQKQHLTRLISHDRIGKRQTRLWPN